MVIVTSPTWPDLLPAAEVVQDSPINVLSLSTYLNIFQQRSWYFCGQFRPNDTKKLIFTIVLNVANGPLKAFVVNSTNLEIFPFPQNSLVY